MTTQNCVRLSFTETMEVCMCWKCGMKFAVPADWLETRMESKKGITCPRGHENHFARVETEAEKSFEEVKAERDKLRDERMKMLHELEQAEARASEVNPRPEPNEPADVRAAGPPTTQAATAPSRLTCPKCHRTFKRGMTLVTHIHKHHRDVPEEQILAIAREVNTAKPSENP